MLKKTVMIIFIFSTAYPNTFNITSIYDLLKFYNNINYTPCHKSHVFSYPKLPVEQYQYWHPYEGCFGETFIVNIPHGRACSEFGFAHIDNNVILEFLPQNYTFEIHTSILHHIINHLKMSPKKINGKVLMLARIDADCYGHWIGEFLTRLGMILDHNIKFDWIYIQNNKPYIKETLQLLGIDSSKIIEPLGETYYIEADELIVPSLSARRISENNLNHFSYYNPATMYCPMWGLDWLRNTFIPMVKQKKIVKLFSKKIFISRKDSHQRRIINEDEVFKLFEQHGFQRYTLSDLSFLEQVFLFNQATHIVGAHGSGLTNLIFCNPNTNVIEIYQNQFDSTFWQLSQQIGLNHYCIKTQDPTETSWKVDTTIPLEIIKRYIQNELRQ